MAAPPLTASGTPTPANAVPIRLIAGLGNPGPQYATTRHNAGFWMVERLAIQARTTFTFERNYHGEVAKLGNVWLLKPATFMNRSGQAVGAMLRYYRLPPAALLVVHDELDFLPGAAKLKFGGGHAGHNGLRDIESAIGTSDFWRLRLGIGHPRTLGLNAKVVDFVLHAPSVDHRIGIDLAIDRACVVVPYLLKGEFGQSMQQLHATPSAG